MNTLYFGDLQTKMQNGTKAAEQHNAYASYLASTTGQIIARYDVLAVQSTILKQHRKFYGLTSKYDGKGNLR